LRKPVSVKDAMLVVTATGAAALLITLGDSLYNGYPNRQPLILAIISYSGWLAYALWYGKLPINKAVQELVGNSLPVLSLKTAIGEEADPVSTEADYTILVFHRGNWCPLCMAQVREFKNSFEALRDLKTHVAYISPLLSKGLVAQAGAERNSGYSEYADDNLKASKIIGIDHKASLPLGLEILGFKSDAIYPTIIIVDRNRMVKYVHQTNDYRKRPSPSFFITLLKSMGQV
jgi:peroxiredoxin